MTYSETSIVIGGLAHVPFIILIANFIKGIFGVKTEEAKKTEVKDESVKIISLKETVVKEDKAKVIKELSNKLDNIEEKADEVYEKVKNKQKYKMKKKKKKKDMRRDWLCVRESYKDIIRFNLINLNSGKYSFKYVSLFV